MWDKKKVRGNIGIEHEKAENLEHLRCLRKNQDLSLDHLHSEQVGN